MKMFTVIVILLYYSTVDGAKILGIFSLCSHSHYTLGLILLKELADRGHQVTYISCYAPKEPIKNLSVISVEDSQGLIFDKKETFFSYNEKTHWEKLEWVKDYGLTYTESTLKHKKVQQLLNSPETFDILVYEHFMNEAFHFFSYKFKCPTVLLAPGPTTEFNNFLVGNPAPPAYVPMLLVDYDTRMAFWERAKNTFYGLITQIHMNTRMIPAQNELLKKIVPNAPDLTTILYNTSLMLLSSHISLGHPVPLQPNIKEIGGYHVASPKLLPKDLQKFLDDAKQGVILFSMGSNLKSSSFPEGMKKAIIKTFSKLKQKVLWKFEADLPEKSSNVKITKWLPQNDILAHPNVVVFITHGGLLGNIEAVYHGVPVLGLPVFWDQTKNMEEAERKGYGIHLGFHNVNEQNFEQALNELLYNPKYRQNVKTRSKIMKDQPVKQLDEAVFWIEYVIRHRGAPHLRPASMDLPWYQLYLLDVAALLLLVTLVPIMFIYFAFKSIFYGKKNRENYPNEKKNK